MQCPKCGVEAVDQAIYCHKCGGRLNAQDVEPASTFSPVSQPPSELAEQQVWHGGYSSKAMLGVWVASGLADLVLLVIGILWVREVAYWLILIAVMVLPWLYGWAILSYRHLSVRYTLTTQRFLHESGILRRVNDRIELLDMDDITFEQGVLDRLVGVGTIRIASHDRTNPELILPGIEDVKKVAGLFDDARLAERRRRGLHIEQI